MATRKPQPAYLTAPQPALDLDAGDEFLRSLESEQAAPAAPQRTLGGTAGDIGLSLLKGAVAVPEAAVGAADLVTGGRAGQALETIGFRPREAREMLDEAYSDPQREAFRRVQEADGFIGTAVEALRNPSVIGHSILESLPLMGAGGVVGRGAIAAAPRVAPAAGAIGEGAVATGSAAEQIRQQTPDGRLTPEQAALSGATGLATGAFGFLGAKVANRLGIADVDTMLAGAQRYPQVRQGVTRRILEGALSEGVLEELPQSVSEQVLQNLALGKPLDEGVDQAAVLGLLSGAAMGGGFNALAGGRAQPSPQNAAGAPQPPAGSDVPPPAPEEAGGILSPRGDPLAGNPGFDVNRTLVERGREAAEDRRLDEGLDQVGFDARQKLQDELQTWRELPVLKMQRRLLEEAKPDLDTVDALMKAGSKSAAEALKKSIDKKIAAKLSDMEVQALSQVDPRWGGKDFATLYLERRREGANQGDAAGHAATLAATLQLAKHAGMSDKAISATFMKARGLDLDEIPDFVERAMQGLADRGIGKPMQGIAQALAGYRDEAILAAGNALLKPEAAPEPTAAPQAAPEPQPAPAAPTAESEPLNAAIEAAAARAAEDQPAAAPAAVPAAVGAEPGVQPRADGADRQDGAAQPQDGALKEPTTAAEADAAWEAAKASGDSRQLQQAAEWVRKLEKPAVQSDDAATQPEAAVPGTVAGRPVSSAAPGSAGSDESAGRGRDADRDDDVPAQPRRDADQNTAAPSAQVATPKSTPRPDGTLKIEGDPKALKDQLKAAGVDRVMTAKDGVVVGKSQVDKAKKAIAPVVPRKPGTGPAHPPGGIPFGTTEEAPKAQPEPTKDDRALRDMLAEAGTKGFWLGRLVRKSDGAGFDVKVVEWPSPTRADWGYELWADGKKADAIPFPAIRNNPTVTKLADLLLDYMNADEAGAFSMDQIGVKHAARLEQRAGTEQRKAEGEQRKANAEMAAMRKFRGDPQERAWDDTDLADYRRLRKLQEARFKTAGDEKMIGLLEQRIKGRPDKWKVGDGASYKVAGAGAMQTNRGFRIVALEPETKMATLRSVADTGLTSSGGNSDRIADVNLPVGELSRDRKYDAPAAESQPPAPEGAAEGGKDEEAANLVQHTTQKGKVLEGYVFNITKDRAAEIDPYTFRKDGGYFVRRAAAEALEPAAFSALAEAKPAAAPEPPAAKEPAAPKHKADVLRAQGQKLAEQGAEEQGRDRNTNTVRRARMASGAEAKARAMEAMGKTLINLADAIERGDAPNLIGITTKAQVEALESVLRRGMRESEKGLSYAETEKLKGRAPEAKDVQNAKLPEPSWGTGGSSASAAADALKGKRGAKELADKIRYSRGPTAEILAGMKQHLSERELQSALGWWNLEALAERARFERAGIKTDDDLRAALTQYLATRDGPKAEDPIKAAERKLIGQKVGFDFFPTPKSVAERMVQQAGIKPGMRVLEPSAGNGNIADAARAAGASVEVVEISTALRELLEAKGHSLVGQDFMDFTPAEKYDAVLMNPPFSNRTDAEHIKRAFDMLKPDGKLIAIAGEGVFSGSDKKAQAFREWLDEQGAAVQKLPEATFKDVQLLATTSANARMVVIDKAGDAPAFSLRDQDEDSSLSYEEVEKIVDELTAKWQNRPDIRVLDSMSEAPPSVLRQYLAQRSQGTHSRVHGFHLKGTVYIVADEMTSRENVQEVLFHESLGHFGLRSLFGDMLRPMLADVILGQPDKVIAKAKAYGLDMNKQADRLMAAEEVLAELAQVRPELGVIRRLVAAIRSWLRDNIPAFAKMKMTDDELIRKFIIPARGFVERGQSPRPTFVIEGENGPETVFALGDNPSVTDSEAFNDRVLVAAYPMSAKNVERIDGAGPLVAKYVTKKSEAPIFIFRENFGREQYKQAVAAAKAAGLDSSRMYVIAPMAPYMGTGIEFTKLSDVLDPEDNRVQFSLRSDTAPDYLKAARQAVSDSITAPGTISWWDKTVGTPYHLAQRHPEFKRVFDRVQDFLGDVSAFATESADRAPTILPKLETWKDILKTPMSAEDTKAVGRPVWEGTLLWTRNEDGEPVLLSEREAEADGLTADQKAREMLRRGVLRENVLKMWEGLPLEQFQANVNTRYQNQILKAGIVWTDAELKAKFGLDARQIGLYREFRAAVDHSITQLALSDMLRYAGKDADENIRRQVLDSGDLQEASEMLRDHLIERAMEDHDRNDLLLATAEKVIAKADQARDLIEAGYAPLMRFGQYTVDVVDEAGNRLYFGLFESKGEAAAMERHMQEEYPTAAIRRGTVSNEEYKLFAGVSPETLELFGEMLGLESTGDAAKDKAFQEYLKLAKTNRSAMRRLIHRKGIAGFSEDVGRVLAGFVYSNARQSAANLHMGEISDAANAIPQGQGQLKDQAVKLTEYVKNPQEEAHGIRGLLFAQYLGGSLAAAMVNMTQPLQVTMPYLSQFGGIKQSASQMKQALADVWKKSTGDAELDAALERRVRDGTVAPQEVHYLMGQSQGRGSLKAGDGTKVGTAKAMANNAGSRLALGWGKFFSAAELFNRRVTYIAAYRVAKAQKMGDPDAFAVKAVQDTQFVMNKGNRPNWARGAVGSVLFTFKSYSVNYLELMQRMYASGPEGKKAALFGMAMLLLMGGAGGLPFSEDISDLIDGIGQRMGYNFSIKRARQQLLRDVLGEALGDFAEKGVSGLPGAPLDVAGRLGMGNLIPGTGIFVKKPDHTRDVLEVIGPAGDFAQRIARGVDLFGQGMPLKGALEASPTAARNLAQSWEMATTGEYRDRVGRKVLETDAVDAAVKAIGFQPGAVAKVQDASRDAQALVNVARLRESEIAAAWAKAIVDKDEDGRQAAREAIAEWNRKNPDTPIRVSLGQVMRRVQNMRMSKAERIEKSAPKEVRAAARRELEQR